MDFLPAAFEPRHDDRRRRSTSIRKGMWKRFLSVSGVRTNPGLMMVTPMPRGSRSNRSDSSA